MWILMLGIIILIIVRISRKSESITINSKKDNSFNYSYYYQLIDEIMHQCWDESTYEFNWQIWFDRQDEIIWCRNETILQAIDDEFKGYGRLQIYKLNALLANSFDNNEKIKDDIYNKLLACKSNIILNLEGMYSYEKGQHNRKICPENVVKYRMMIYKLLDKEISWNQKNVHEIINLGRSIVL